MYILQRAFFVVFPGEEKHSMSDFSSCAGIKISTTQILFLLHTAAGFAFRPVPNFICLSAQRQPMKI